MWRYTKILFVLVCAVLAHVALSRSTSASNAASVDSEPGQAGYALLFNDHVLSLMNPKGFPTDQMTFEAWVSTADYCHEGTIMSYAIQAPDTATEEEKIAAANHFTIYNTKNIIGCHDIAYFKNLRDVPHSCYGMYKPETTVSVVDREASWHHLAVTWDGKNNGLTRVFLDGSLMTQALTNKTRPLQAGGFLAIGQEQDCFAGCFQTQQGFFGAMDEIRIWKKARSQEEISKTMRYFESLEGNDDLIAYWKFDDPVTHPNTAKERIHDWSGKNNHLPLVTMPSLLHNKAEFKGNGHTLQASTLSLHNAYLINKHAKMPQRDFTIEFWARGDVSKVVPGGQRLPAHATILSYAAKILRTDTSGDAKEGIFADDAIRITRVFTEHVGDEIPARPSIIKSTVGTLSLHVNSNPHEEQGNNFESWIDFETDWQDDKWHHIAVTWDYASGDAHCYMDGSEVNAFWKQEGDLVMTKANPQFAPVIAKQVGRTDGVLILGVDQDCYGSCLKTEEAFGGELAMLRIWDRVRQPKEIRDDMYSEQPSKREGLLSSYMFKAQDVIKSKEGEYVKDRGTQGNNLRMRGLAPRYVYSTAPLSSRQGIAAAPPKPGRSGYALQLSDKQVVMVNDFRMFPTDAITVEFWMKSSDRCRKGAPFSYATGEYGKGDNSFLIFNYNSLGVSVMEEEGLNGVSMHTSGVSVTDGRWHHVAVTWVSSSGDTRLYLDSRLMWVVTRGKGVKIQPGGTLVIGREQDCLGGCFDSMAGAAGKTDDLDNSQAEYGPQDFTGAIENLRIWKRALNAKEIQGNFYQDVQSFSGVSEGVVRGQGLLASYSFDEGKGFLVKDSVYGNHMHILTPSKWEVMDWRVECGNGIVERGEQCDDGDVEGGNGCSATCQIESGWTCEEAELGQPSYCFKGKGGAPSKSHSSTSSSPSRSPVGPSTTNPTSSHKGGIAAGVIITIIIFGALVVGYIKRQWVYEVCPPVERAVDFVGSLVGYNNRRHYAGLHLDAEELDLSPEFIQPSAARTVGSPGMYVPMPDGPQH